VVELMFTLEQLARIYGGGIYGDRLESVAFNLLPASFDPRMFGHQYHQQANQVLVSVDRRPWTYSSDDANIFGLEPHFGCCTANFHQGWPKLVRSSWVQDPDDGLRVIAYAPVTVSAEIDGVDVTLDVQTNYPFEEIIGIHVSVSSPVAFPIRLRLPEWVGSSAALEVNGIVVPIDSVSDGYFELSRVWSDGDVISLRLPMRLRVERREGQSAALRLGPLVLVHGIPENWVPVAGAPGLGEWEVHPRTSWNWGLDLESLDSWAIARKPVGNVPFARSDAVVVRAKAAHVPQWTLDGAQAGPLPNSPVLERGPIHDIILVPYGMARLRVTEFPVIGSWPASE
ncbi:MAG: beta-L-arabinofuranosidase domain-containing protein, partial [Thermomicrobiales bacterium]